jgi:SAM-dependent methyltransferase
MTATQGPNAEQTRAWDGPEGDTWTENEDWYNAAVGHLSPRLLAGAALTPSDRVLDLGCGCGETTRDAARAAAFAFGIDLSGRMIERARERAGQDGLSNLRFERGDAQVYAFEPESFDVAISRFGCMFFDDPVRAFTNVRRALAPGGRIAMLCWREIRRNEWLREIRTSLAAGRDLPEPPASAPSPVSLADPERVRAILSDAGFTDAALDPVDEPIYFGTDADAAFHGITRQGVVRGLLADLDERAKATSLDRLRATVERHASPEGVLFGSSAWLFRAEKSSSRGGVS